MEENEFARCLNMIRRHRKESVSGFANTLEMSRSQVESLLLGKSSPRLATVYHIAGKLGVKPCSLICGELGKVQAELIEHIIGTEKILEGIEEDKRRACADKLVEIIELLEK